MREERDEKRGAARALGVAVVLRYFDVTPDERWRRIQRRAIEGAPGSVPLPLARLTLHDQLFQALDQAERNLFDQAAV